MSIFMITYQSSSVCFNYSVCCKPLQIALLPLWVCNYFSSLCIFTSTMIYWLRQQIPRMFKVCVWGGGLVFSYMYTFDKYTISFIHAVFMCILFHSLWCYSIDTQCVYVSVYRIIWCPPLTSSCSPSSSLAHITCHWLWKEDTLMGTAWPRSVFWPHTNAHTDAHVHLTIGFVILGKDGETQVTEKQWILWYCFQPNEHTFTIV